MAKKMKIPAARRRVNQRLVAMNDVIFGGRGNPDTVEKPEAVVAEIGSVYCLVLTVGGIEFVSHYCRMAVFDRFGIRLLNPFRRSFSYILGLDCAYYLPKDLYVFCAARLEESSEQEWMARECF